jgi:hypothetical protein
MEILLVSWVLGRHPHLTLKSSICNTKPTGAARLPSHAVQFLQLLEFTDNIPSTLSAKSLAIKPVHKFPPNCSNFNLIYRLLLEKSQQIAD